MKEQDNQEELYPLSGWDNIEDNLSYSEIYLKKLQQQIEKVVNSKLPQPQSLPNRTHLRNKSKQYFSSKISNSHLRRDKQFLHQYIKRQKASFPEAHINLIDNPSPEDRLKYHNEILNTKNERHQHHKTSEISIGATKSPSEDSHLLDKYILFSGIHQQKCRKRRFFISSYSKKLAQKKSSKEIDSFSNKSSQIIIPYRLNFQKVDQTGFQKVELYAPQKKGVKFPLFYRQLNSNDKHLRKDKYKSTINLRQKIDVKFSEQFTDDNIFQTRFVQA